MKRSFKGLLLAAAAFSVLVSTSCKKSSSSAGYKCSSCITTPDAVAAYDNSSKGIYKGTVVGSTGTIKFNIGNNDSTITATMVIDGTSVLLTATVAWVSGSAYVSPFTGTMNGSTVSITFSVGPDGTNPTVTSINIPGHPNAVLSITKETSSNLIMVFEGTYQETSGGSDKGTFDLFLSKTLKAWRISSSSSVDPTNKSIIDGTYDDASSTLNYSDGSGGVLKGTLVNDQINGTFNSPKTSGTWTCKRTL